MTIVGYLRPGGPTHKILGRCDCGNYERRNLSKWHLGLHKGTNDAFQECKYRERLRRAAHLVEAVGMEKADKWGPEQKKAVEDFYFLGNVPEPGASQGEP